MSRHRPTVLGDSIAHDLRLPSLAALRSTKPSPRDVAASLATAAVEWWAAIPTRARNGVAGAAGIAAALALTAAAPLHEGLPGSGAGLWSADGDGARDNGTAVPGTAGGVYTGFPGLSGDGSTVTGATLVSQVTALENMPWTAPTNPVPTRIATPSSPVSTPVGIPSGSVPISPPRSVVPPVVSKTVIPTPPVSGSVSLPLPPKGSVGAQVSVPGSSSTSPLPAVKAEVKAAAPVVKTQATVKADVAVPKSVPKIVDDGVADVKVEAKTPLPVKAEVKADLPVVGNVGIKIGK